MELVEVEITGQAVTAQYGVLSTGTILRTDAAFARHLVEDCGAAKYTGKQAPAPADPPAADEADAEAQPDEAAAAKPVKPAKAPKA